MNELLANLRQQWNELPPLTRRLAIAGFVLTTLLLLYTALWRPLQRDLQNLRTNVPQASAQLEWMRSQAPVAKALRAKASTTQAGILTSIEQSTQAQNIRTAVTQLDADGDDGARVSFEAVAFNSFLTWLSELQSTHGVAVEEATVEAHATPGMVNVRLRLRSTGR